MFVQPWVVILEFSQEKMSSRPSTLPPCLLMSLHVSTKGFPSFSQLNNILLCTFTHLFYPFNFWWILRLLPSLDYCCDLTFENVLTINMPHFPSPIHPLSEGQISCFSKPGPEGQICLYWRYMIYFIFLKFDCMAQLAGSGAGQWIHRFPSADQPENSQLFTFWNLQIIMSLQRKMLEWEK